MSRIKDRSGQRFGFWTVQSFVGLDKDFRAIWLIKCECGTVKKSSIKMLLDGTSKSCRCGINKRKVYPVTHGHYVNGKQSPEYRSWAAMLSRTRNPANNRFYNYGSRGIKVCERWIKFSNFVLDMGLKPSPQHSIERKDNYRGYEPDNCEWATVSRQNSNKRNTIRVFVDGRLKTLSECEKDYGVRRITMYRRLAEGWIPERAVRTKVRCK